MFYGRKMALLTDLYELTMANGYFKTGNADRKAVFDLFYRNNPDNASYSVFAGLEDVLEYLAGLRFEEDDIAYLRSLSIFDDSFLEFLKDYRFRGDVYAFKEGSIVYPEEPLITVVAPLLDAQIVETGMLSLVNHESLIATKANRIVLAAKGRTVSDFGARRSHGFDAAFFGAKASYIGGVNSTATVLAGKEFHIPVSGTMAHAFVMAFDNEYDAFLAYSKIYPDNIVLLIDTYDVLSSGIQSAIKLAKDYLVPNGLKLKGVRIDSGDLAYLSKKCRKLLDQNGLEDTKIIASNSLDEYKIRSLIDQGAQLDSFGVGENLITSKSSPVFGGVYKLAAIEENGKLINKVKLSNTVEKITTPCFKEVYRVYSDKMAIADLLAFKDEEVGTTNPYPVVYPKKPWKKIEFTNVEYRKMHQKVMEDGKVIISLPSVSERRAFLRYQVEHELWEEEQRFEYPHIHYLDFTKALYAEKLRLVQESQNG